MTETFEKLAAGLSDENKAEFYKILNEAGISQNDRELAKLFRAFQFYKSCYEEIPRSVQKAAGRIGKIRDEVEKIADRVAGDAHRMDEAMKNVHLAVHDAAQKTSAGISNQIRETLEPLNDAVKTILPAHAAELEKAGKAFTDAVETSKKAAVKLRNSIKIFRRSYVIACASAVVFVVLGLWGHTHYRYTQRLDAERAAIVSLVNDNQHLLLELAKSNRRLVLTTDKTGARLLFMNNAEGWTSSDKHGVIEFR